MNSTLYSNNSASALDLSVSNIPLGLYVHWPFCAAKCPYCDFNSHVRDTIDHQAWQDAYLRELRYMADKTPTRELTSIFFGGGTPSLMQPHITAAIIEEAQRLFGFAPDIEITLEANPTSVEIDKFKSFYEAGVNRVSLGIQALDDTALSFLGRQHNAAEALHALDTAHQVFDRVTFDLIYARPEQSLKAWQEELRRALSYVDAHMSLYQLTIEPGTRFFTEHARGAFKIPQQDEAGDLYEATQEVMSGAGLPAYEVSNHAKPGQESRHNLIYWRYHDYIGIGPGAHGRISTAAGVKYATRAHRAPEIWLQRVEKDRHGYHDWEEIGAEYRFIEALMMGLRLHEGINLEEMSARSGISWQSLVAADKLTSLQEEDMLQWDMCTGDLRVTNAGIQRLNSLLSYLL